MGSRGINDYELTADNSNKPVAILRGTFTIGELSAIIDAMNEEQFEVAAFDIIHKKWTFNFKL